MVVKAKLVPFDYVRHVTFEGYCSSIMFVPSLLLHHDGFVSDMSFSYKGTLHGCNECLEVGFESVSWNFGNDFVADIAETDQSIVSRLEGVDDVRCQIQIGLVYVCEVKWGFKKVLNQVYEISSYMFPRVQLKHTWISIRSWVLVI